MDAISTEADKVITLAGNAAITTASVGAFALTKWRLLRDRELPADQRLSAAARSFAIGLELWTAGEILRIGWWVLWMLLAPEGEKYHPIAFDYRAEIMMVATPLIVYGVAKSMREIRGKRFQWKVWFVASCFSVGWLVAVGREITR